MKKTSYAKVMTIFTTGIAAILIIFAITLPHWRKVHIEKEDDPANMPFTDADEGLWRVCQENKGCEALITKHIGTESKDYFSHFYIFYVATYAVLATSV